MVKASWGLECQSLAPIIDPHMFRRQMRVLLLCGSLRRRSSNRAMLEAFAALLPPSVSVVSYDGLARLPHFNPDDDKQPAHEAVSEFRDLVASAAVIAISTPEYAHGLPGSFKNALDWLVSDERVQGKRACVLAADRGSRWALDSLLEVLRTMGFQIDESSVFQLRLGTNLVEATSLLGTTEIRAALERAVASITAKS